MTVPLRTRVLLADDHAVVRRGLRHVLDAHAELADFRDHQPSFSGALSTLMKYLGLASRQVKRIHSLTNKDLQQRTPQ